MLLYIRTGGFFMVITRDELSLPQDFPCLINRYRLKKEDNKEDYFHYHDFCEVTYIEQGKGRYLVNGSDYLVQAGDIVIFNQEEPHGWLVEDEYMDVTALVFSPEIAAAPFHSPQEEFLRPFLYLGSCFRNLIESTDERTAEIYAVMEQILSEDKNRQNGYQYMIRADIIRILILLVRHYEQKDTFPQDNLNEKKEKIGRLEKTLNYINGHFMETITLEQAAALSYMSPTYFSGYFRKVTSRSFREYVTLLRLSKAQELIQTQKEDLNMTQVAMECGFHSMSNFYKLYKKHIGPLPGRRPGKHSI